MRSLRSLVIGGLLLAAAGMLGACESAATEQPPAYSAPTALVTQTATLRPATPLPPSATPPCDIGALFLEDLTIPDGEQVRPGEELSKRWAVQNVGSCDWGPGYRLVRTDSGPIEGPAELALYPARAGETAVWVVALVAPDEPGEHMATWQARSPDGAFFGDQVFILIEVIPGD